MTMSIPSECPSSLFAEIPKHLYDIIFGKRVQPNA